MIRHFAHLKWHPDSILQCTAISQAILEQRFVTYCDPYTVLLVHLDITPNPLLVWSDISSSVIVCCGQWILRYNSTSHSWCWMWLPMSLHWNSGECSSLGQEGHSCKPGLSLRNSRISNSFRLQLHLDNSGFWRDNCQTFCGEGNDGCLAAFYSLSLRCLKPPRRATTLRQAPKSLTGLSFRSLFVWRLLSLRKSLIHVLQPQEFTTPPKDYSIRHLVNKQPMSSTVSWRHLRLNNHFNVQYSGRFTIGLLNAFVWRHVCEIRRPNSVSKTYIT